MPEDSEEVESKRNDDSGLATMEEEGKLRKRNTLTRHKMQRQKKDDKEKEKGKNSCQQR